MLPSPEDLAAHVVPAVGAREVAGAEVAVVAREEATVVDLVDHLVGDMEDVAEVGTGDSEGEAVVEVEETEELPEEFLEECAEVVVEVVVVVRVRALHFNSLQQLISRSLQFYSFSFKNVWILTGV